MYTVEICCGEYYNVLAVFVNKQLAVDYAYYYASTQKLHWLVNLENKSVKVIDGDQCVFECQILSERE